MVRVVSETFFRPDEIAREQVTISGALFNRCRLLLARRGCDYVFVPIRSAQILAVLDSQEIIFVDGLAYAVRDGEGGRLIVLAWVFSDTWPRDNLNRPVPLELLLYRSDARELHDRLIGEFDNALEQLERRGVVDEVEAPRKKVLRLPSDP